MILIDTGQEKLTPQQRDDETLAQAIKRREAEKVAGDFVRKNHGRMKIDKEGGLDEVRSA